MALIASVGTLATQAGNSLQQKIIFDGTRYWAFYYKSTTANTLFYAYSSDLSSWTESSQALACYTTVIRTRFTLDVYYLASANTVLIPYVDAPNETTGDTIRYVRGVISGTSITWWDTGNSGGSLGYSTALDANTEQAIDIVLDSSNYPLCLINYGSNPGIHYATNQFSATFADVDASWTSVSGAIAGYYCKGILHPLANRDALYIVFDNAGGNHLQSSFWTQSTHTFGSNIEITSDPTEQQRRFSWGSVKVSNSSIWVLTVNYAGDGFILMETTNQGTSWTSRTAPTWPTNGLATNSEIALATDGTDVWAFLIRGDSSSTVVYNKYDVSEGTWGGWTSLVTGGTQTRAYISAHYLNSKFVVMYQQTNGSNYDIYAISAPALTYFGYLTEGTYNGSLSSYSHWNVETFTCSGTGQQNVKELSGKFSGSANVRMAIYTVAGAFVMQGATEIAVTDVGFYTHTSFVDQAGSPITSPQLTGGTAYRIIASGDGTLQVYGANTESCFDYAVGDLTGGFPSTAPTRVGGSVVRANYHVGVEPAGVSATITGTAIASITEADIVSGGRTIIITLSGDQWIAS